MTTYPYTTEAGQTVYACCESRIGPTCDHLAPYATNTPEYRVWRVADRNGKAAASSVFDGNTTTDTYQAMLAGIENGDPEILDSVTTPSLSGEYDVDALMADIGWVPHDGTDMREELAAQYADEVEDAFWHEVERTARYQLTEVKS